MREILIPLLCGLVSRLIPGSIAPLLTAAGIVCLAFWAQAAAASGQSPDSSVRTATLQLLQSDDQAVRLAALRALERVGRAGDVPVLARFAATGTSDAEQDAAYQTLTRLRAPGTDEAIAAELPTAEPRLCVTLIGVLVARRAAGTVPDLLQAAEHEDPEVRLEALRALRALADPSAADALVGLLMNCRPGEEREAADRALWASCQKTPDKEKRAEPVLRALEGADAAARCALLPALGRLGGQRALDAVHAAMTDPAEPLRDAAVRALGNWPDAQVADELLTIAKSAKKKSHRVWALRGFIRVVSLPGQLPPQEAFQELRQAVGLAERTDEKRLVLARLAAVRVPDALGLALGCARDEELQPDAIATMMTLAGALWRSHPAEVQAALKRALAATEDKSLRERIERLLDGISDAKRE